MKAISTCLLAACISFALMPSTVHAERLKDLAGIQGCVRISCWDMVWLWAWTALVIRRHRPFTVQSIVSMLQQMGISLPTGTSLQLKNVAAVMVTASLPPFAQPGQAMDVTVSSMGNAKACVAGRC
jgi:flagellar P-ring protein precursor FlgI